MDIISMLTMAKSKKASDLHLITSCPPLIRVNGSLEPLDGLKDLTADEIDEAFVQITTAEKREEFHRHLELDFGYTLPSVSRLRLNAAMERGCLSLTVRILSTEIPTIDELELPNIYKELILKPRGLIIITGTTGSGKSTSQAAMIRHLNNTESRRIVTIEDPVEYIHTNIKCAITQRELGSDTRSFSDALKHCLRQDPDVILLGEMRDLDTAAAVLSIAESGHLVLTTSHAPSASQAIERVVDLFPPEDSHLAQTRLASLLLASLFQVLVPRADGSGRISATEIMLANSPVRNLIREGKIYHLPNVIRTHREIGMMSLDQSLVDLYLQDKISGKTVLDFCNDRQEVEKLIGKVIIK